MKLSRFVVTTAAEAVAAVRAELGPEAVVVSVKQLPQGALGWLSGKSKIEVTACVPDKPEEPPQSGSGSLDVFLQSENPQAAANGLPTAGNEPWPEPKPELPGLPGSTARNVLETMGLLPRYAENVLERINGHRNPAGASLASELALARAVLTRYWNENNSRMRVGEGPHVFVGPPGTGKTTVLCKWLTQVAFVEGASARTWRLDGATANQAESLSVYCEILGVPIQRRWTAGEAGGADVCFVDLPGVSASDVDGVRETANRVAQLGRSQVHLVLNAAYGTPLLLKQLRAFSGAFPGADLIFTHLDEETSWGKLWNFVIGTNFAIRSLSAGQNIPGYFVRASAEHLLPSWFPQ